MSKILVETDYCWADEFNVPGWCIVSKTKLDKIKNDIREVFTKSKHSRELYFGTNEALEFSSYNEVFSSGSYSERELTDEEVTVIERVFGSSGGMMDIVEIAERLSDNDDYYWDDDDEDEEYDDTEYSNEE